MLWMLKWEKKNSVVRYVWTAFRMKKKITTYQFGSDVGHDWMAVGMKTKTMTYYTLFSFNREKQILQKWKS